MPSSPPIAIRCDRTAALGAGHLTRCRALGDAIVAAGGGVVYVLGESSRAAADELAAAGYAVSLVEDGSRDAEQTAAALVELGAGCVVVDSYAADDAYLSLVGASGAAVGVVDDLANRELVTTAWILNQNLWATPAHYRRRAEQLLLLGPQHALLRPQFAARRARQERAFSEADDRLLVTFGSSADAVAVAGELVAALEPVPRRLDVRVFLGSDTPPPQSLARAAGESRHRIAIQGRSETIDLEMGWADVSLNAGGSTCWELLCLGTPMVVTAISHDQDGNAEALGRAGLGLELPQGQLARAGELVETLLADPQRRERISRRGRALVDGHGAARAAASLLGVLARRAGAGRAA